MLAHSSVQELTCMPPGAPDTLKWIQHVYKMYLIFIDKDESQRASVNTRGKPVAQHLQDSMSCESYRTANKTT